MKMRSVLLVLGCAALFCAGGAEAQTPIGPVGNPAQPLNFIYKNSVVASSVPVPLHTQTTTYLNQITTNSCSVPTTAWKNGVNYVVDTLLANGSFSNYDFLYIFAAADQCTAKINLVSPSTLGLTVNGSPTFVAYSGYSGDGSTGYLTNGVNYSALVNCVQNNCHYEGFDSYTGSAGVVFGSPSNGSTVTMTLGTNDSLQRLNFSGVAVDVTGLATTTRLQASDRTSSAGWEAYSNGVDVGSQAGTPSAAPAALAISILRSNATTFAPSGQTTFMVGMGAALTGTQEAGNSTVWNRFLQNGAGALH